jgi:alpha-amylase
MENQDQVRFAQLTQDKALAYNALAFQFLTDGIPILYYGKLLCLMSRSLALMRYSGMEQDMPGGVDPENRAALWTRNGGFSIDATPTVKRVAAINKIHSAFASHLDITFSGKNFIDQGCRFWAKQTRMERSERGLCLP